MMMSREMKLTLENSHSRVMKRFLFLLIILVVSVCFAVRGNEPYKGYRAYVDAVVGSAYNPTSAQKVSINNMQWYSNVSTTYGYCLDNWFVGVGLGYYHSYKDKENIYPAYAAGRYTFEDAKLRPYIETRAGIVYDPYWISKVQAYGALGFGMKAYARLQVGLRLSAFSRPSRYFTANAAFVLSYGFGK